MINHVRYAALVLSFPVFADVAAFSLGCFDLHALDRAAIERDPFGDDGVRCTGAFLLNLFSTYETWECGKFDLFEALRQWDPAQRAAFQAWAADPWRP